MPLRSVCRDESLTISDVKPYIYGSEGADMHSTTSHCVQWIIVMETKVKCAGRGEMLEQGGTRSLD